MSFYRYQFLAIRDGGDDATVTVFDPDGTRHFQDVPLEQRRPLAEMLAGDGYRVVPAYVPHGCQWTDDPDDPCPVCGNKLPQWERELLSQPRPAQPVDRDEFPRVQGKCPSCGVGPLFLAEGGHVCCSWVDCRAPEAADAMLHGEQPDRPAPVEEPSSVRVGDVVEVVFTGTVTTVDDSPLLPFRLDSGYWPPVTTEKDATVRILRRAEVDLLDPVAVIRDHQRLDAGSCACGWGAATGELGRSHSEHVWHMLRPVVIPDDR